MKGHILLEGGAEFGGQMEKPDRAAIDLVGGLDANIQIIPTAAVPDHNHTRAGNNALRWFRKLGAHQVQVLPLIDRQSAGEPKTVAALREARLVYLLGGFTHYLGQTLLKSPAWDAMLEGYRSGALIAGSSAGAMVLCEHYYDPGSGGVHPGLALVPDACVLPHHNTFGESWARRLQELLPGVTLIGIDERTGMIDDDPQGAWQVYGSGVVTLYKDRRVEIYKPGEPFEL